MSENTSFDHQTVLAAMPHRPGVYRMLNDAEETLYVGKARDLKKRVASYFQKTIYDVRIAAMVEQISRIETTITRTEGEALLLENNLIKKLQPRYNIVFRDDKSYPYVCLTGEKFSQLRFHRGKLDAEHRYFGPFPSAGAVRDGIALLQKVFQLRTCENTVFNNRSRPCMLHQIQRCSAPCINLIKENDYQQDVQSASLFLQGKTREVIHRLQQTMEQAAERLDYEHAARLRDKITRLQTLQSKQFVATFSEQDADVIAVIAECGLAAVNLVMIRGGQHLGDKTFFPQQAESADPTDIALAFLSQHYVEQSVPPLLVVNVEFEVEDIQQALLQKSGSTTATLQCLFNPAGTRKVWLDMAIQNAKLAITQRLAQKTTQEERLSAMQEALSLPSSVQRIECFDISHTMGEAAVASCVVFDRYAMQSGEYRRFNVKPEQAGDDYAAMREALTRRVQRIVSGEVLRPDLMLIDGGRGQLTVAAEVLAEQGLHDVYLLGIAKGADRKPGLEQLIFPDRENPLQLPFDHPGLHLLQQIRDEAHRFAIQGHRQRRARARTVSALQEIAGIGDKRRRALLTHFGGLKGVTAASVEDLLHVPGINRSLAEKIYAQLHS